MTIIMASNVSETYQGHQPRGGRIRGSSWLSSCAHLLFSSLFILWWLSVRGWEVRVHTILYLSVLQLSILLGLSRGHYQKQHEFLQVSDRLSESVSSILYRHKNRNITYHLNNIADGNFFFGHLKKRKKLHASLPSVIVVAIKNYMKVSHLLLL